jgi:hypothetical protein
MLGHLKQFLARAAVLGNSLRLIARQAAEAPKPRILLLVDSPGWAYDTAAKAISAALADEFEFRIAYADQKPDLNEWPFDLVYVFWWGTIWHQKFASDPRLVMKEVSSHRWAEPAFGSLSPKQAAESFLSDAAVITATSKRLQAAFSPYREIYHTPNGFEPRLFYNQHQRKGSLRIGWAGNQNDPCKGVNDILRPAAGDDFELVVAGGKLKHEQMAEFYNSVDVICVASTAEGEPLPLVEALACGCFPVAVNVGIVPELIRHGDNGLIVDRSPAAFRSAFEWCEKNLAQVRSSGDANSLEMLQHRTWAKVSQKWRVAFLAGLKEAMHATRACGTVSRPLQNVRPITSAKEAPAV